VFVNANELKAKARERLAEIAKGRTALDAEERELRVMLGDVPPAPTVSLYAPPTLNPPWDERLVLAPPMPYDVRPFGPGLFEPLVTCADEARALAEGVITSRTTGCAVPA
jgi:hypothetical protein